MNESSNINHKNPAKYVNTIDPEKEQYNDSNEKAKRINIISDIKPIDKDSSRNNDDLDDNNSGDSGQIIEVESIIASFKLPKNRQKIRQQVDLLENSQNYIEIDENGNNKYRFGDSLTDKQQDFWHQEYKNFCSINGYDKEQQYRNLQSILSGSKKNDLKQLKFELKVSEIEDLDDDIIDILNSVYGLLNSNDIDLSNTFNSLSREIIYEIIKILTPKVSQNIGLQKKIQEFKDKFVNQQASDLKTRLYSITTAPEHKLDLSVKQVNDTDELNLKKSLDRYFHDQIVQDILFTKVELSNYEDISKDYLIKVQENIKNYIQKEFEENGEKKFIKSIEQIISLINKGIKMITWVEIHNNLMPKKIIRRTFQIQLRQANKNSIEYSLLEQLKLLYRTRYDAVVTRTLENTLEELVINKFADNVFRQKIPFSKEKWENELMMKNTEFYLQIHKQMLPILEKKSVLYKSEYCHNLDRNIGQKFLANYDHIHNVLYTSGDTFLKRWNIKEKNANEVGAKSYDRNLQVPGAAFICQMHIDTFNSLIYQINIKGILFMYRIKGKEFSLEKEINLIQLIVEQFVKKNNDQFSEGHHKLNNLMLSSDESFHSISSALGKNCKLMYFFMEISGCLRSIDLTRIKYTDNPEILEYKSVSDFFEPRIFFERNNRYLQIKSKNDISIVDTVKLQRNQENYMVIFFKDYY